jgi:hypothetical protein
MKRGWATIRRRSDIVCAVLSAVIVVLFGASITTYALNGHQMSVVDEHVHFDTAVKMQHGELVHRGSLYGDELVHEWACGVGHQGGPLPHACGDPALSVHDLPSGIYSTGYIHYPTYFAAAAAFHAAVTAVFGPQNDLSVYRLFSAILLILGVVASGVSAWILGIRRSGLIAAVTLPVAASSVAILGGMVTPNSTVVLAGALIAVSGFAWVRRGKGFVWVVLATAFASCNAVIDSLPVGAFLVAILGVVVLRWRGWVLSSDVWRPTLWHFAGLAAIVVAPVIAWGRYIAATATVNNSDIYGAYAVGGWRAVLTGAIQEFAGLHSPWYDGSYGIPVKKSTFFGTLRLVSASWPTWITVFVFGALLFIVLRTNFDVRPRRMADLLARRVMDPLHVVAVGALITVALYPVALRVSNVFTFGIDSGIVARYSTAFGPLLALLILLAVPQRRLHRVAAIIGTVGITATSTLLL